MKQIKRNLLIRIGCLMIISGFLVSCLEATEDIDITGTPSGSGNHRVLVVSSPFVVWNTDSVINPDTSDGPGDTPLDNLEFYCTNLTDGESHYIMHDNITFDPQRIEYIASGYSQKVFAYVHIPEGTYANSYTGTITVRDNDGYPEATVGLTIIVNPSYDLDISDSDTEADLVANTMNLQGQVGLYTGGEFRLINPNNPELNVDPDPYGNADLTALNYKSTALICNSDTISAEQVIFALRYYSDTEPAELVAFLFAPDTIRSGEGLYINTQVYIPGSQEVGTYTGKITVADTLTGVADSFTLNVNVTSGVKEQNSTR